MQIFLSVIHPLISAYFIVMIFENTKQKDSEQVLENLESPPSIPGTLSADLISYQSALT